MANDLTPDPIRTVAAHRGDTATIRRLILHFNISSVSPETTLEVASFGIYVASHEALAQSAFNDPNADAGQDWYYWTSRALLGLSASDNTQGHTWDVDIRSQRRLRGGYDLILVSAGLSSNTIVINSLVSARALWSIP